MAFLQKIFSFLTCLTLVFTTVPLATEGASFQEEYAPVSAEDLDAMVAPIALYPDELVGQVLGAATYPEQVVEANDWLQANSSLQGQALMQAADQQNWDDAVKAMTLFPSVLSMLANNLAWTSALGEAAATQQADVMAAIQRMRAKAFQAGNLKTTKEIKVIQESPQVIVIQPATPQVVYVPTYNPTVVYGAPVVTPGYSAGDLAATAIISFGVGVAVGALVNNTCCGWGYGWGMHWGGGGIYYHRTVYYGNPYWQGRPPGYYPGYRPPYYPPRPPGGHYPPYPPSGGRPPYPPPGGGRPPGPPPSGGKPLSPPSGGGRPPAPPSGGGRPSAPPSGGGGGAGGGRPPVSAPSGGGGAPSKPGGPGTSPGQGAPGVSRPATRPSPATPMPGQKDLRGYGSTSGGATRSGAFGPSPSDRSASMRGNESLGNTPRPAAPKAAPKPSAAPARSAPQTRKR